MLPLHLRGEEPLSISGTVSGDNGNAITGAVVSALVNDSTAVDVAITDETGRYVLGHPGEARFLKASKPGFTDVIKERELTDGGEVNFTLTESPVTLDEFIVTARRATLQSKPGMFVFNPGDIAEHVPNAARVLEYVPLIQMGNNTLKILSKKNTALIHINGKLPVISQTSVLEWLQTMQPDKIKGIEIIMNPGVRYGGDEQNAGIVNIILDDDHKGTFTTASVNMNYDERQLSSIAPNLNLFYQNHNFLLNVYANHYHYDGRSEEHDILDNTNIWIRRETTEKSESQSESLRAGINGEYRFGLNSIGIALNYSGSYSKNLSRLWQTEHSTHEPGSISENLSVNQERKPWMSVLDGRVRYIRVLDRERTSTLTIMGIYSGIPSSKTDRLMDVYPGSELIATSPATTLDQSYKTKMANSGFDATYDKRFADGSSLVADLLAYYVHDREISVSTDDRYDFTNNTMGVWLSASYNRQWSRIFATRVGVKEQFTRRWLYLNDENERYNDSFFNFIPNVSLSFSLGGGRHNINVDWTAYTRDPSSGSLNPHKSWISSDSYYMGNPHIGIKTHNKFSLQYSAINRFFFSAGYLHGKGMSSDYIVYDTEGNTVFTPMPNKTSHNLNLDFNYNQSFFNYRWTVNASASMYWRNDFADIQDGSKISNHSVNYSFGVFTRVVILPQYDFSATARYGYFSKITELTSKSSHSNNLSFGLRKGFDFNLDISANINIPLNETTSTLYSPGLTRIRTSKYRRDISASLSLSWYFGKTTIERLQRF